MDKKYRVITGAAFILAFNNPSPGNPELKMFQFDDDYLYAEWEDGDKTKTKVDKIEQVIKDGEEIGIKIWFGDDFLPLSKEEGEGLYGDFEEDEDEFGDDDFDIEGA